MGDLLPRRALIALWLVLSLLVGGALACEGQIVPAVVQPDAADSSSGDAGIGDGGG